MGMPIVIPYGTNMGTGGLVSIYLNEVYPTSGFSTSILVESDCYLNPALTISDFVITGTSAIASVTYLDSNHASFILSTALVTDTVIAIQALATAFLHNNGDSLALSVNVQPKSPNVLFGRNDLMLLKANALTDTDTISVSASSSFFDWTGTRSNTVTITADTCIAVGPRILNLNARDNSYMKVYYQDGMFETPNTAFVKIVWDGCAPYTPYDDANSFIFEAYFFSNGDMFVRLLKQSTTWDGAFDFMGVAYTISMATPNLSFYAQVPNGVACTQVYETYNANYVHEYEIVRNNLGDITNTIAGMSLLPFSTDDASTNLSFREHFAWRYNGVDRTYLVISGNSWIGLGAATEDIKYGRLDNYLSKLYEQFGQIQLNGITQKFWKITWYGKSPYNGTDGNHVFEVIFFENGDAQITSVAKASTGEYSFLGVTFTIEVGQSIAFYRQNVEGTSWVAVPGTYDITKHAV